MNMNMNSGACMHSPPRNPRGHANLSSEEHHRAAFAPPMSPPTPPPPPPPPPLASASTKPPPSPLPKQQDKQKKIMDVRTTEKDGITPQENDVLIGRGRGFFQWPGNQVVYNILKSHRETYDNLPTRHEKGCFLNQMHAEISRSAGRFLEKNKRGGWQVASSQSVKKKFGQAIRYMQREHRKKQEEAGAPPASTTTPYYAALKADKKKLTSGVKALQRQNSSTSSDSSARRVSEFSLASVDENALLGNGAEPTTDATVVEYDSDDDDDEEIYIPPAMFTKQQPQPERQPPLGYDLFLKDQRKLVKHADGMVVSPEIEQQLQKVFLDTWIGLDPHVRQQYEIMAAREHLHSSQQQTRNEEPKPEEANNTEKAEEHENKEIERKIMAAHQTSIPLLEYVPPRSAARAAFLREMFVFRCKTRTEIDFEIARAEEAILRARVSGLLNIIQMANHAQECLPILKELCSWEQYRPLSELEAELGRLQEELKTPEYQANASKRSSISERINTLKTRCSCEYFAIERLGLGPVVPMSSAYATLRAPSRTGPEESRSCKETQMNESPTNQDHPKARIGVHDVLGSGNASWPGNERYRVMIARSQMTYRAAGQTEKAAIVNRIIRAVTSNGGRFWERKAPNESRSHGSIQTLSEEQIIHKVSLDLASQRGFQYDRQAMSKICGSD